MKSFLVFLSLIWISYLGYGQDKIVKKDGNEIQGKVIDFNGPYIKYKKIGELNGPDYLVPKDDATEIIFENNERYDVNNPAGKQKEVTDAGMSKKPDLFSDCNLVIALGASTGLRNLGKIFEKFGSNLGPSINVEFGANFSKDLGLRLKYGGFLYSDDLFSSSTSSSSTSITNNYMVGPQYSSRISKNKIMVIYLTYGLSNNYNETRNKNIITNYTNSGNAFSFGTSIRTNTRKKVCFQPGIEIITLLGSKSGNSNQVINLTLGIGFNQ